jgi:hypothetical protein
VGVFVKERRVRGKGHLYPDIPESLSQIGGFTVVRNPPTKIQDFPSQRLKLSGHFVLHGIPLCETLQQILDVFQCGASATEQCSTAVHSLLLIFRLSQGIGFHKWRLH